MAINQLTAPQEEQAFDFAVAMAEKFDVDYQYFAIIQGIEGVAECQPAVIYAARIGIYLANAWEDMRGTVRSPVPEADFAVEVNGKRFDTRKGLSGTVYHAMAAQNPNEFDPDTPIRPIRRGSGTHFPRTWITGDSATPHWAPVGHVNVKEDGSKQSEIWGVNRHADQTGFGISFRPGIPLTRAG